MALPIMRHAADPENAQHRRAQSGRRRRSGALSPGENSQPEEGLIEQRVEPRHGTISRAVRGRRQVIVSNVDQLLIVASVAEPY